MSQSILTAEVFQILATQTLFEKALIHYSQHNFMEAAGLLTECLNHNAEDPVAQIYLKRCEQQII